MELLFRVIMLGLFSSAAWTDYYKMKIHDVNNALLWEMVLVFAPASVWIMAALFAALFLINSVVVACGKKQLMGWGDVLYIPPLLGFLYCFGPIVQFIGAGVVFYCFLDAAVKKKPQPVAVWAGVVAILASLLG